MPEKFDFKERLGSGHFGEVWRVIDTGLNVERALKVIPPSKVLNPANFFHEAQILKAVEHANVVKVEETGTLSDGRIYIAMELLQRGSLEDQARGNYIELTRAKRLLIDMLRGLEHAHSRGILHRDIKPANILIGPNLEGKLSDFGLAIPAGLNLKALGVREYQYVLHLAPEIFGGQPHSIATDIYACGITVYRIINGDVYFVPPPPGVLAAQIRAGSFPDRGRHRDFVPQALRKVVERAIAVDPASRYQSAAHMRRALEQLTLEKNWLEKNLVNGTEWVSGWDRKCYEVRCVNKDAKWEVTVKKGPSRSTLRRVIPRCSYDLNEADAKRKVRRILQDFVLGKID